MSYWNLIPQSLAVKQSLDSFDPKMNNRHETALQTTQICSLHSIHYIDMMTFIYS